MSGHAEQTGASSPVDLRLAAAWIAANHRRLQGLRHKGIVVKIGGSIQDDPAQLRAVCRDVAALAGLGARPVVVHGGGKAITAAMAKAGMTARFVQGQRYTDAKTLEIVERVLIQTVNRELVDYLHDEGCAAQGLHSLGSCVLMAERTGTEETSEKASEDLGFVGRVVKINAPVVLGLCEAGSVPVIAPVALDAKANREAPTEEHPGKLNVNADLAAGTVAACLHSAMFVLVSDTPGIRTVADDPSSYALKLSKGKIDALIAQGVIAAGMLPKVRACFEALAGKVRSVSIVDGRVPGALMSAVLAQDHEEIAGTRVTLE